MQARLCAVGTSVPPFRYTQDELINRFNIEDDKIRSLFKNSSIASRHLVLPPRDANGKLVPESQGQLLDKHREWGIKMAAEAMDKCLANTGRTPADVDYLCCVTTTGYLTPGLSARLMKHLDMRPDCARLDVVGMGCNGGLNGLASASAWAETHPGQLAMLICVETCSAAYVFDGTMKTAVVNSLFGDGAAALAISTDPHLAQSPHPLVLRTSSHIILDALDAMRYDWDDNRALFSFHLDPEIPYVIGANAETALSRLLSDTGLDITDIDHWVVHSGGKKVLDALRVNLGLSRHDVRHSMSVLRDYGNLSSGSFLFTLERLNRENIIQPGEYGVITTMGPGSTIEMALIQWT
ncbi:3,5-dihydroxyphenylacetyl-CoA synthase DpgA [Mycobacterium sp. Z3061]|uniref:3,5-dihydroxyphenylacetyl-CoA synthase DpgA n=1 Tax=Mycobacterium sp. Z3061 TaxID=3073562 RepID=UPI002873537E|nr:3,5-dihydroxyphenylacetyl-CoA synthase DpgA [Mycobacterium sp. Z3061]